MIALLAWVLLAAPDLGAEAVAVRAQAEAALADFRAARVAAQAGWIARVDAAQGALSAARVRAAAAVAAVGAAERGVAEGAQVAAARAREVEALRRLLAEAGSVDERLDALARATRVEVGPQRVHDRAGRARTVPVVSLGGVRRLAAGGDRATVGLVVESGGVSRVAGPALGEEEAAAVRRVAAGGGGEWVPVDVSGEWVEQSVGEGLSGWGWLAAGGPFMWPIVALGLAALLVGVERGVALVRARPAAGLGARVVGALGRGAPDEAMAWVAGRATPLARVLAVGVEGFGAPQSVREAALEAALAAEDLRLDRGLRLLAVFAGTAPLLGLLGTVSGMIGTFEVIAVHGTGEPRLLSGGIAQALLTTQLGLMVAVPTLLLHAVLARLAERRRQVLESAAALVCGVGSGEVA